MKKLINIMVVGGMLIAATACEKELPLYNTEECRLNFYYEQVISGMNKFDESMINSSYSFIYAGSDVMVDTMWYEVETMGFVYDTPRSVALEQVSSDTVDAVPGVHYVPFDDASLAKFYQIPAGAVRAKLPVVVKRDTSLKSQSVFLKFKIKENENFKVGYPEYSVRQLVVSDQLAKPTMWEYMNPDTWTSLIYYYGDYGAAKHQFLIDQTGEKWDDEYIVALCDGDNAYFNYLFNKMCIALDEYNAERTAQGLPVLTEEDGTPVSFIVY